MLGAILGDLAGSAYESQANRQYDVPLFPQGTAFTDDSVMTTAVASVMLQHCREAEEGFSLAHLRDEELEQAFVKAMLHYGRKYPHAGYGGLFAGWLRQDSPRPYDSWGNGSAMRVSPIGYLDNLVEVQRVAAISAHVSHNHPEAIEAAVVVATCVYLARSQAGKLGIQDYVIQHYPHAVETVDHLRKSYSFTVKAKDTVPQAVICFIESEDLESCLRNCISIGGDADTLGAIAGAIAYPFYNYELPGSLWPAGKPFIPEEIYNEVLLPFTEKFQAPALLTMQGEGGGAGRE